MASGEVVNQATISSDSRFGILSKSGPDAKKMFTDKVVPISVNYPFFFKPIQDGMDRPKTELAYRVPASKLTRRKLEENIKVADIQGLDTTIDWKNDIMGESFHFENPNAGSKCGCGTSFSPKID